MKRLPGDSQDNRVESRLPLDVPAVDGARLLSIPGDLADSLRRTITRLGQPGELPRRIALVAALREEGVTFLARALGATIANDLTPTVCVVELNLWWPAADHISAGAGQGLAGVLSGKLALDKALIRTGQQNLAFLPAGGLARQERPIVARGDALKATLDELGQKFDHLILDIPAILATSDAVPLAGLADGCCLVIQQGVTSMEKVREALDEIDHLRQLGVILNQTKTDTPPFLLRFIPQA